MDPIQFIDLIQQQKSIESQLQASIHKVLSHGKYVLGPEVDTLEKELAAYTNAKHVVTCANGTDALKLVLMTKNLSNNDAVFVPSFTFAATAEMVAHLGATPFFVDVDINTFNICPSSLKEAIQQAKKQNLNPKGIIAVDLFGLPANYIELEEIANQDNLWLIADAAQSFGAKLRNNPMGSLAEVTTTSFFPAKPLGCYGDGGAIFIKDNHSLHEELISLRNHGAGKHRYDHIRIGLNSRLDTLQAAILLEKLKIYNNELAKKQAVANFYNINLPKQCQPQQISDHMQSAWAIYTIKVDLLDRDNLNNHLIKNNIPSPIYYQKPLHIQKAYEQFPRTVCMKNTTSLSKQVLSLPMHAYLQQNQLEYIIKTIKSFYDK
jgi:dTDP-4-amino-4,6-dideoxygalactose transaminase